MNVQIHPAFFQKISLSEPFSLMIDVAARTGYSSHRVYVAIAIARAVKLPVTSIKKALDEEINSRSIARSVQVSGGTE
ncbi:hypothetical protein ACVTD9_13855 [Vibrio cholerae]